eukprot:4172287-Pyramimonas_sp.AAC.1
MSATVLGAGASASAPVRSGCCMGLSCLMYSSWPKVTLPSSSLVYRPAQVVYVCLLSVHFPKGVVYALDRLANGVLSTGHTDIINMFGREQVAARGTWVGDQTLSWSF